MKILISILIFFVLLSCTKEDKKTVLFKKISQDKNLNKIINDLGINSNDSLAYYYYEKFGFNDVCYHYRLAFIKDISKSIVKSEWKPIPFSINDKAIINNIPNKVDSISNPLYLCYQNENFYEDINLERLSFMVDSFDCNLKEGYYKLDKESNTIVIYNKKILYIEKHICN